MFVFKSAAQAGAVLAFAQLVRGHGYVQELTVGGTDYTGYLPYNDPYTTPTPTRIVRSFTSNGPVADFTTDTITCNDGGDTAAGASATVAAGDQVEFFWTAWPSSHEGPTMTYMAKCDSDDCSTFSGQDGDVWFKIDHAGLNDDLTWASDTLIANNNSWTVTIPDDIAPGGYLLRHELLALHGASTVLGAQFYPMCAQLVVTGSGTAEPSGVALPGAYATDDPGILINIYYPTVTSYDIPGPTVYTAGGSTGSTAAASSSTAAASSAATSAAASAATSAVTSAATSASVTSVASSSASASSATVTSAATSSSAVAAVSSSASGDASACPVPSSSASSAAATVTSASSAAAITSSKVETSVKASSSAAATTSVASSIISSSARPTAAASSSAAGDAGSCPAPSASASASASASSVTGKTSAATSAAASARLKRNGKLGRSILRK
ncbi:uncharacterized protein STEHIDRAFT_149094 [Stereum hirsutum FP-91666 SS1]|uniref:uncharacterized protein n=1 Tax=Stereum hirsutum (strain FP-91666) TaxID=721885 RepID=UPI000444A258|nr:uncharacterized protein STEHIDRAFT_149094 [Stereum hirsutum FP-91666 SS1]EIM83161.1 hypothetical protein STEHIDRAFT_149094 [Stereum hirsutum FP-91666 SS1]